MKNVVSFSGGKDSTAMLLMMVEKNYPIDQIVNVDTGYEFEEVYQNIEKVSQYIKPLTIDTIKIDFDYWFKDHIKTKGKHKGEKGYGWPDFRNRWCTRLKLSAIAHLITNKEYDPKYSGCPKYTVNEYVGITYDEKDRCKDKIYPLVEWKITSSQALQYCYDKGFNWGGLYEDFTRLSCYICPLQRIAELKLVYDKYPKCWDRIKELDTHSKRDFKHYTTVQKLDKRFKG